MKRSGAYERNCWVVVSRVIRLIRVVRQIPRRTPVLHVNGSTELASRWRNEAEIFERRGAANQAATLKSCADELEQWMHERELEKLTLIQAAKESGYSYSALQKMVADGRLPNVGDKNRPRVRRGNLPQKPRRLGPAQENGGLDLAGTILANRT